MREVVKVIGYVYPAMGNVIKKIAQLNRNAVFLIRLPYLLLFIGLSGCNFLDVTQEAELLKSILFELQTRDFHAAKKRFSSQVSERPDFENELGKIAELVPIVNPIKITIVDKTIYSSFDGRTVWLEAVYEYESQSWFLDVTLGTSGKADKITINNFNIQRVDRVSAGLN